MEYNKQIQEMAIGDRVEGFYVLRDVVIKTSSNGKPFLSGVLTDQSGSIDIKVWDYSGPVGSDSGDAGKVIKIRGDVSEYKGQPQLTLSHIRLAQEDDIYDVSRLVPVAPIERDAAYQSVVDLIDSMEDLDYRNIAKTMLLRHMDAFRNIPAAKNFHHGFLSGLLMHTSNMLKIADFLSGMYGNIINRSLLLTGAFLHDFAKETEFCFSELGIVTDYSVKGMLLGHLVMGAQEVKDVCRELDIPEDKSVLLQHMILSHHGEPDFGAAVRPMFAEAELLSYIDLVDSRMEIYEENLRNVEPGTFSNRIFALDKKIYNHG